MFSPTQLWIVAPHPLLAMVLLKHQPAQLLEGWWPTLASVGMRSPPQQWLPVWLVGCGRLYQLVPVSRTIVHVINSRLFTAVDCGSLDALSNGAVDTSSGTTFMMTATYTCNTGYNIVGSESRTCGASGVWSREAPVCNCKINWQLYSCFDHIFLQWFLWAGPLLTTLPYHWRPLERVPLPSPVILSYPPVAGHKTTAAMLSEDGEDQMVAAFLTQTPMDSTCHGVWAPLVWTLQRAPVNQLVPTVVKCPGRVGQPLHIVSWWLVSGVEKCASWEE